MTLDSGYVKRRCLGSVQLDMNTESGLPPAWAKSNTPHYLTIISKSASRPKMQDLCVFFVSRKVEPLPKRLTLLSCPVPPVRPIPVFLASPTSTDVSTFTRKNILYSFHLHY